MRIINDAALKQALIDGTPYDVTITVTPVGGSAVTIDMDHIAENGISINPSSVSGNRLELGTVISSAATFTFYNHDGSLDGINFKGAEIHVEGTVVGTGTPPPQIGTAIVGTAVLGGSVSGTFDVGYFIADTVKEQNKRITVSCFDRMILFDVGAHMAYIGFPLSLYDLVDRICYLCGVTLATPAGTMPNYDLYVMNAPEGTDTYRQLIGWAAALMGRCAMINNEGELELKWYEAADWNADTDRRFEGGESSKVSITTTGVRLVSNGVAAYTAGADGYTIDVADNGLVTKDNICLDTFMGFTPVTVDTLMDNIWSDIGPITYYPVRTDIIHNVVADVFDVIDFPELDGTVKSVAVTDVVYNISARTAIQSKGQSEEEASYAQQNPFTPSQAAAVADAGRLKIGRIESVDETIYYDLDTGEIHTENTTERVTSGSTKATYKTDVDFKDGGFDFKSYKNGSLIGEFLLGPNGIEISMDSSEGASFPKPSGWDGWTNVMKAAWWVANYLTATGMGLNNIANGSLIITDKNTPSSERLQAGYAAGNASWTDFDYDTANGKRSIADIDGFHAQKISYTAGNASYTIDKQSQYLVDKAEVAGTIAALTGIKIGATDYDDPAAKAVATEEYVQSYIQSLLGDYIVERGTSGIWTYEKWLSGKAVCWGVATMSIAASGMSPVGSFFYRTATSSFPSGLFDATPELFTSVKDDSDSNGWLFWVAKQLGTTKTTAYYTIMRHTNPNVALDVGVNLYAVGTWQ